MPKAKETTTKPSATFSEKEITQQTTQKVVRSKKSIKKKESKTTKKTVKPEKVKEKKKTVVKKSAFAKATEGKEVKKEISKPDKYFEAVGRRKTAVARVRLFTRGEKTFFVNGKPYKEYFPLSEMQQIALASLRKMKCLEKFRVSVKVKGGGYSAQAEAVRHGATRALVKFNPNFRKRLRKAGYLTRDPRMRERKKFGLKRARRAPQWSKR